MNGERLSRVTRNGNGVDGDKRANEKSAMRRRARAGLNTGRPHSGFGTILERLHRKRQPGTLLMLLLGHRV